VLVYARNVYPQLRHRNDSVAVATSLGVLLGN
jgi:hypothetical protein